MVVQLVIHDQVAGVGVDVHSLTDLSLHWLGVVADQLHSKLHLLLLPLVVVGAVLGEGVVTVALGVLEGFQVLAATYCHTEPRLPSV